MVEIMDFIASMLAGSLDAKPMAPDIINDIALLVVAVYLHTSFLDIWG